jgi:alkylation response protein AidB-like acyl-CoA dehydrogenase
LRDIARTLFDDEHQQFRATFRAWLERRVAPNHAQWERDKQIPRELWREAGELGIIGMTIPEEFGGGGTDDYRFSVIIVEELARLGVTSSGNAFTLHNDIVLPYILGNATQEQRQRWLPGMANGEIVGAIAMTEPNTGSDLGAIATTATRHGKHYVVNGSKTFISNGITSDLVVVAVKTDPSAGHRGISLLVIERGMAGFERGRNLDKLGMHAQDTAEMFFRDVEVPLANLLGEEGNGFAILMKNLAQERLGIAVSGVAVAQEALDQTLAYTRSRIAFRQPIAQFQHIKFLLAELSTEVQIAQVYLDRCIELHLERGLSAEQAAAAKYWCTELQNKVVDRCLQLHGGYGYMLEYPIARAWVDSRVQTIYGGTTEIMKEIIGRAIVA